MAEPIRNLIPNEEFDYPTLVAALAEYARPRDKITQLLRNGVIVRVKKGLYLFGASYRRRPYSPEILANLLYGPSYLSLEYALQHYGLIPEGVEALTSVTTGRSRRFLTPAGLYTYSMIPLAAFRIGMTQIESGDGRTFLIAQPEKALADKIWHDRGVTIRSQRAMESYLLTDLRLDFAVLASLDATRIADYAKRYRSQKLMLLAKLTGAITANRGKTDA